MTNERQIKMSLEMPLIRTRHRISGIQIVDRHDEPKIWFRCSGCPVGLFSCLFLMIVLATLSRSNPLVSTTTITEADQGKEIRVRVGDELTLRLSSSPGTGYTWSVLEIEPRIITSLGAPTLEKTGDRRLLGGPEDQVFRYRAAAAGVQHLQLEYRRPWEKAGRERKIFAVTIVVQ